MTRQYIKELISRISMKLFGITFYIDVYEDERFHNSLGQGRKYLQIFYLAHCNKTGRFERWTGRKWYLSDFMTDDEVIKTAWCAYEAVVKHEILETFLVDGKRLFNPHVNYEELLEISDKEVRRS